MSAAALLQLKRFQAGGLVVGIVGLALCAFGFLTHSPQFFSAYLFGYLFWLGLALGCFGVAMIHHLTGGQWGNATRRFLEAGFMTLPLMAILFVPIFFGLRQLYPWARPEDVASDKALQSRVHYMNSAGFIGRTIFCFAIWIIFALCLRKWSLQQDTTSDVAPTRRLRALSGPGIIIYPFTVTLAYLDWVMSLEPDWYSTLFFVIICIGQILNALAFAIILVAVFKDDAPLSTAASTTALHHLGNLLLAFVIFWTYVTFAQYLIIWAGNLPHEIVWYLHRSDGTWKWLIIFLAVFHFFFPFLFLLFRGNKRSIKPLAILAALIFLSGILDVFWLITPSFSPSGISINWLDLAAFFGIGGLWATLFGFVLQRSPLIPLYSPKMQPSHAHAE